MYIPEFWGGVFATIFTEVVLLIVAAIFATVKKK